MTNEISVKLTVLIGIVALICAGLYILMTSLSQQSSLVFCDVGQGDAAYLRIKNRVDVLIDAGADRKILHCLSRHMPFYDRTIEYAFLSHPQKDHYGGFLHILERYTIATFVFSYRNSGSKSFNTLLESIRRKQIRTYDLYSGSELRLSQEIRLSIFWPSKAYVKSKSSSDPNHYSQILLLDHGGHKVLFTGDIEGMTPKSSLVGIPKIDILKVPHHGGKNGLRQYMLERFRPVEAVISVGRRNSYGHPHIKILNMLKDSMVKIRRTDLEGDIVYKL